MDRGKSDALKSELAGQQEPQMVSIDRFFDGNDDVGSIGCNLILHPGIGLFRERLTDLLQRPDVAAVYAQISELDPDEDAWPFADTVIVVGSISPDALRAALVDLQPDEVGPVDPAALGMAVSQLDREPAVFAWWD